MKTKILSIKVFILLLLSLPALLQASPWIEYLNEEQRMFCEKQMAPVLELYEQGKQEEALEELEQAYLLAEEKYDLVSRDLVHFFHRIIWWEAQTRSGREDPDWGYTLYAYLYQRDTLKKGTLTKIPGPDYVLFGNIMNCLLETGKAAEARAWILKMEDSLCEHRGLNVKNTSVYADLGPLFSFMPEARKRNFPLYRHQVPELKTCKCTSHPIYYTYLYGINYVADEALKSGDWVRAAELYFWYQTYTDMYICKASNSKRNEVFRGNLEVIQSLAKICTIHGHPEKIIPMYERAIEQIKQNAIQEKGTLESARLHLNVAKIELGTITADAIPEADQAIKKLSSIPRYSRSQVIRFQLQRARIYHALGLQKEAWGFVNELFEQTKKDVNPYLWTYILTTMIDLAFDDGATHPELENWLILALKNERLKGNKFGELPLYEKYAALLLQQGRYDEALLIQQEALRLSKAMNLHERIKMNQDQLNQILIAQENSKDMSNIPAQKKPPQQQTTAPVQQVKNEEAIPPQEAHIAVTKGITSTKQTETIDIQPYESKTVALDGEAAHGRLYIYNPAATPQSGTLRFSGPLDQINWINDTWLSIGSSPELPSEHQEESLSIPAGASCIVDLTGIPDPTGKGNMIHCEWIPEHSKKLTTTARWTYSTATNDTRTAVIDAHTISENPFYLIPIHHMIQRQTIGAPETIDFSIASSTTMRIEVYDAETFELISIDANGDGDFKDSGDFIGVDSTRNNWPDITFKPNQKLASIVMYIRPDPETHQTDAELTIQILDNNEWRIDAVDIIEFKQ